MILCFLSRWRCEYNKQHSLIKVTCPFVLRNQLSVSPATRKIMQYKRSPIYEVLNLSWKLFLQIFQNLNITSHEFNFVLRTHSTAGYFEELMRLPLMADVVIFILSTQFQKRKRFAHFIRLIFLLTCKKKF